MSKKVLIVTGDGGDSYEALYAYHRFLEALWQPVIAAPTRRRLHMVIHDTEPGWETYIERQGYTYRARRGHHRRDGARFRGHYYSGRTCARISAQRSECAFAGMRICSAG